MKLKRIGTILIAIVLLTGGSTINVTYATKVQMRPSRRVVYQHIIPLWNNIADISPYISSEGTTLYPEVYIKAKSSSGSISGTMHLERYDLGRWINVTSWSFKGTGNVFLSKNYRGVAGNKYRTKAVVNINGETAEATSGVCEI